MDRVSRFTLVLELPSIIVTNEQGKGRAMLLAQDGGIVLTLLKSSRKAYAGLILDGEGGSKLLMIGQGGVAELVPEPVCRERLCTTR